MKVLSLPSSDSQCTDRKEHHSEDLERLSISKQLASSTYYALNEKYVKLLWLQLIILFLWSFVIMVCGLHAQEIDGKLSRLIHNKIMVDTTECAWPM